MNRIAAAFIIVPLLMVLFWNYGMTEVIQHLGGPDANVNIIDGALATYFVAVMGSLIRSGLA
jgi:hypothetical protein